MKTEKKLTNFVWFMIKLFPLFYVLIFCLARSGSTTAFVFEDLVDAFGVVVNYMNFQPVFEPLLTIFTRIVGNLPNDLIIAMCCYVSYLVFVELLYFLYFFFTFLFRLMRNWMENWG